MKTPLTPTSGLIGSCLDGASVHDSAIPCEVEGTCNSGDDGEHVSAAASAASKNKCMSLY